MLLAITFFIRTTFCFRCDGVNLCFDCDNITCCCLGDEVLIELSVFKGDGDAVHASGDANELGEGGSTTQEGGNVPCTST